MKKLQIVSIIVLAIAIVDVILWRFFIPLPDIFIRIVGSIMLITIFTTVLSTVRVKRQNK